MKLFLKFIFAFIIFSFQLKADVVKNIVVEGNKRVSSETIKLFSEVEINQDLNINDLNEVIKKLYNTNFFTDVTIDLKNNVLNISVTENPIIQTLEFKGVKNKRIINLLREQVELREKNSFIENLVKKDKEKITNILRTNGYYFSKVSPKIKNNDNNTIDLIARDLSCERVFSDKFTLLIILKIRQ